MTTRRRYFEHRKAAGEGVELGLSAHFQQAFVATIDALKDNLGLDDVFYTVERHTPYQMGEWVFLDGVLRTKLTVAFGDCSWPPEGTLGTERLFGLVEFFYDHLRSDVEKDPAEGRARYAQHINELFERFNNPYKLHEGNVILLTSGPLDSMTTESEIRSDDEQLQRLLQDAFDAFYDRSGERKLEGVRHLANALERIKTLEGSGDKKAGAKAVVERLAVDQDLAQPTIAWLKQYSTVSNQYNIRHHETDVTPIADPLTIEFLFYSYYNLIRFIMLSADE